MKLYLDSALIEDARAASQMGWVTGITTNPTLLAKSDRSPEETLQALAAAIPGEVLYQLMAPGLEGMLQEAQAAKEILGSQFVAKIPATPTGFQATARLVRLGIPCAVTAVYSPAQALVASEAGAKYALVYVNRATRLLGDGLAVVKGMRSVLEGSQTEVLAASVKSAEEAVASLQAGAQRLTLPRQVLEEMMFHELSEQAVQEFARTGRGIRF